MRIPARGAAIAEFGFDSETQGSKWPRRPRFARGILRDTEAAQPEDPVGMYFKLHFSAECLGTTWTGSPVRDPIVFFRTVDMPDTSRWQRLPAEFDRHQAKARAFTPPDHLASRDSE